MISGPLAWSKPDSQPGDHFLYRPDNLFGWIIALKTWTRISHIEIYIGNDESVASRPGTGVGIYPARWDHLARVLRPKTQIDMGLAMQWFQTVNGQAYDRLGLLVFALARRKAAADRKFCSNFATYFERSGKFEAFAPLWPADRVAPSMFLQSYELDEIWSDGKLTMPRRTLSVS